jgi:kynurenine formamidase
VRAVGTDCLSLDSADGGRGELPAHFELLERGILILENVANLSALPVRTFLFALPLPIRNGTGSPLRLVAALDAEAS